MTTLGRIATDARTSRRQTTIKERSGSSRLSPSALYDEQDDGGDGGRSGDADQSEEVPKNDVQGQIGDGRRDPAGE